MLATHRYSEVIRTCLSVRPILSFIADLYTTINTKLPLAFSPNQSINSLKMDSEITMFGDYCRQLSALESCLRSPDTGHQQTIRPQEASLIRDCENASTPSIQAAFRAKLEVDDDTYIATRDRLASMLRV